MPTSGWWLRSCVIGGLHQTPKKIIIHNRDPRSELIIPHCIHSSTSHWQETTLPGCWPAACSDAVMTSSTRQVLSGNAESNPAVEGNSLPLSTQNSRRLASIRQLDFWLAMNGDAHSLPCQAKLWWSFRKKKKNSSMRCTDVDLWLQNAESLFRLLSC